LDYPKSQIHGCSIARGVARADLCGSKQALNLLQRMLTYAPSKRITCRETLEHPYFATPIDTPQ